MRSGHQDAETPVQDIPVGVDPLYSSVGGVLGVSNILLDGVTTVTPSVRYLAFRAWLIHRYGQTGRADSWQAFTDFAARIEGEGDAR